MYISGCCTHSLSGLRLSLHVRTRVRAGLVCPMSTPTGGGEGGGEGRGRGRGRGEFTRVSATACTCLRVVLLADTTHKKDHTWMELTP